MPEFDENDKFDIIFTLEDCKYDLEEHEKRIIEIKQLIEELPYLEANANKIKFIMNKLQEKLEKIHDYSLKDCKLMNIDNDKKM